MYLTKYKNKIKKTEFVDQFQRINEENAKQGFRKRKIAVRKEIQVFHENRPVLMRKNDRKQDERAVMICQSCLSCAQFSTLFVKPTTKPINMKKNLYLMLGAMSLAALQLEAQVADSASYMFTGGIQTFTVPCGVTSLTVRTWGAQGGAGANGNSSGGATLGGSGGLGAEATGTLAVNPGDVLNIFVGGQGATPTGGFNGGANGGSQNAGGGGGATDIRVGGTAEANRVITAGGGGGGGRGGCESGTTIVGGNGGAGGGVNGANGVDAPTSGGAAGGGQGGQGATGGAAGIGCGGFLGSPGATATTGTGGTGGAGQSCCCFSFGSIPGGGGGGGGQIGGGGGGGGSAGTTGCSGNDKGAGGGGAGGTVFLGGVTNPTVSNGIRVGDGMAQILWVNPVPPAHTITGSASAICQGDTATFSITADAFSTFYTWTVDTNLTFVGGQNTTNITVVGSTPGTYTIYVQGVNGTCSFSGPTDSIMLTVNALPTVGATAGTPAFCLGGSTTLTGSGASTYAWEPGSLTGSPVTVTPASTTTYTVTGTDSLGCVNSATVDVTVNQPPVISASADSAICAGGTATLVVTGNATGYVWNPGSLTGTSVTVTPTSTTTYTVVGTDANGCMDTAFASVTVNALPTVTLTTPANVCVDDGSMTLTGGSPSGGTYSGPGVTGSTFSPAAAGVGAATITYNYTDANGCSGSNTSTINVNACVGINDPSNIFGLTFMPNPVTDLLQVRWDGNKGNVNTLEVFDNSGRLMISQQVNNATAVEIKVDELPVGNYNLVVKSDNGKATYRFVKK